MLFRTGPRIEKRHFPGAMRLSAISTYLVIARFLGIKKSARRGSNWLTLPQSFQQLQEFAWGIRPAYLSYVSHTVYFDMQADPIINRTLVYC